MIAVKFHSQYDIANDKTIWAAVFEEDGETKVIQAVSIDLVFEGLRDHIVKKLEPMQDWYKNGSQDKATLKAPEA